MDEYVEWFTYQSEYSQLVHLSELMYDKEESAKTEFERLLNHSWTRGLGNNPELL